MALVAQVFLAHVSVAAHRGPLPIQHAHRRCSTLSRMPALCDTVFSHVLLPGVLQSSGLICVSAKCSFRVFAAGSSSGLSPLSLSLSSP